MEENRCASIKRKYSHTAETDFHFNEVGYTPNSCKQDLLNHFCGRPGSSSELLKITDLGLPSLTYFVCRVCFALLSTLPPFFPNSPTETSVCLHPSIHQLQLNLHPISMKLISHLAELGQSPKMGFFKKNPKQTNTPHNKKPNPKPEQNPSSFPVAGT